MNLSRFKRKPVPFFVDGIEGTIECDGGDGYVILAALSGGDVRTLIGEIYVRHRTLSQKDYIATLRNEAKPALRGRDLPPRRMLTLAAEEAVRVFRDLGAESSPQTGAEPPLLT